MSLIGKLSISLSLTLRCSFPLTLEGSTDLQSLWTSDARLFTGLARSAHEHRKKKECPLPPCRPKHCREYPRVQRSIKSQLSFQVESVVSWTICFNSLSCFGDGRVSLKYGHDSLAVCEYSRSKIHLRGFMIIIDINCSLLVPSNSILENRQLAASQNS